LVNFFNLFFHTLRLEEESTVREASLAAEKQENEVTKKTLTEALDQIEELVKEIECANNNIHQLQDSIQRSVYSKKVIIHETSM
jgi:myosin-5